MNDTIFCPTQGDMSERMASLRQLLNSLRLPYGAGDSIAVKVHWGERGNTSFLPPEYTREIVGWLYDCGMKPFVFDTTVLYSGGRRTAADSLKTAENHGYSEAFLRCPVVIGDGHDGRDVIDIEAHFTHFDTVQVTRQVDTADGFFIFSHFKGHMASGFGGAIKNISMGFASRAQKQRMHADVRPVLHKESCTMCGLCVDVCPTNAAHFPEGDDYPDYDRDLCTGCAQCIGLCPEVALEILWATDATVFQEKLVETTAAVWKRIKEKTLLANALFTITTDCDCWPGHNPVIAPDVGFVGGYDPVHVDRESLNRIGAEVFTSAHPAVPWHRQFYYWEEIDISK